MLREFNGNSRDVARLTNPYSRDRKTGGVTGTRTEQQMINLTELDLHYAEHDRTVATANSDGWKVTRRDTLSWRASRARVALVLFRIGYWLAPEATGPTPETHGATA